MPGRERKSPFEVSIPLLVTAAFLLSGCGNQDRQNPSHWEMKEVWNVSTVGIPFMDLRPNGGLAAVIDYNSGTLYLVKPDGEHVEFSVKEDDTVSPVVANIFILDDYVYVSAQYENFDGVRIYTWEGLSEEQKLEEGTVRGLIDAADRSPSGNHSCYLVTGKLYCDGGKFDTGDGSYNMLSVSDDGYVAVGSDLQVPMIVVKNGREISSLDVDPHMGMAYKDKIITQINNSLVILNPEGQSLAANEGFSFGVAPLLKITPKASKKYLFAHKPFEKTHVLDWNLEEVRTLPGYPEFANENFVVTSENGELHCYSLKDFHEVWTVKPAVYSIGYVKISDDGKVMLVSGDTGDFYLYD